MQSKFIPYSRKNAAKIVSSRFGGKNFVTNAYKTDGDEDPLKKVNENLETVISQSKEAKATAEKSLQSQTDLKKQLDDLNADNAKWRKEAEEMRTASKENQDALNTLLTDVKTMKEGGIRMVDTSNAGAFDITLSKAINENVKSIANVTKGKAVSFDLPTGTGLFKAAANMTTAANLTGSPNITYVPQPVLLPRQMINFRDLVPSFQSQTGLIAIFRENGGPATSPQEGGFGQQTTAGALKEQVGYDFTNVQFTANYISGFVRISKQMLQDLLFLQTYLPQMLLRDYFKYENSTFFTAQAAAALGTNTAGGNDAETFINNIANLETYNFAPNGIVTTPLIWAKLMKTALPTSGTSYSVPGGFYINPATGMVEIAGIPVLKATWLTAGTALTADWTQSQIATVDGLRVEFFEQDSDNVQRNLITVRVEARVVLVTSQPYAFTYTTGLG